MKKQTKELIRPITLEINPATWNTFKTIIPRHIGLNAALVRLIENFNKQYYLMDNVPSQLLDRKEVKK
jgi:hypothetical protein